MQSRCYPTWSPGFFGFSTSPECLRAGRDPPAARACCATPAPGLTGKTRLPKGDGEERKPLMLFTVELFWVV